jgi:hypothetical protein
MADEDNESSQRQQQNIELRRALNDAYAFVEGQKATQSFTAITFEDLMDQQIERLEGKSTISKPNEIDRINKVENALVAAVEKIKKMPDDAFKKTSEENNVNTKP